MGAASASRSRSPAPIGRVASLLRYPVKSMAGEDPPAADLTSSGMLGDRAWALVDRGTGRVVSAKRPRKWPGILDWRAEFEEPPATGAPLGPVRVTPPGGPSLSTAVAGAIDRAASERFGTLVDLANAPAPGARFEYHWPDIAGLAFEGRVYRDQITEHEMPRGTFFDSGVLHLLTTASLAALGAAAGIGAPDPRRFRPNIVIEVAAEDAGFVENAWVGRTLRLGDGPWLRVVKPCLRCVMVTLAQQGLPADLRILQAAFRHNGGHLGVKADVVRAGRVGLGDPVWLV